jgi:hypothetical protein
MIGGGGTSWATLGEARAIAARMTRRFMSGSDRGAGFLLLSAQRNLRRKATPVDTRDELAKQPAKLHLRAEFALLPWGDLDSKRCGKDWSFGFGGNGLGDKDATLRIHFDDGEITDIWLLPELLSVMLRSSEMIGESNLRCAFKRLLAI